jgi:hypothetical protein
MAETSSLLIKCSDRDVAFQDPTPTPILSISRILMETHDQFMKRICVKLSVSIESQLSSLC